MTSDQYADEERKGWQGFCTEVGRWEIGGHGIEPVLLSLADEPDVPLSTATRFLRRLRIGESEASAEKIEAAFRRSVQQIRQRFPGVSDEALREGARAALDELS